MNIESLVRENQNVVRLLQTEFEPERRVVVWFSCGAASAVAAKLAVDVFGSERTEIAYCDTLAYEHPDNVRFLSDVEKWVGKPITLLRSDKYRDIYDVFRSTGWLIGPAGARCTVELKKNVRKLYQRPDDVHVFGLTADEEVRIDRFEADNDIECAWLLRDFGVDKTACYRYVQAAGIELPEMYKLGYNNNNCIGCVKGGAGYWNKIRRDFPAAFDRMAQLEREMDVAINKRTVKGVRMRVFLDELDPEAGRDVPPPDIDCGVLCRGANRDADDYISIYHK